MIKKLLIANRGEIAVRVNRAAQELGIQTVQVHSSVDKGLLALDLADEVVELESSLGTKSYMDINAILAAAWKTGADAIHPGYGFLSENANFAEAVEASGITFVGPAVSTIRTMGDKATARKAAKQAGIPIVPGSDGVVTDLSAARQIAEKIEFPIMIKAAAGGGGRGIRVARCLEDFGHLVAQAATEAKAVFGDGDIYLEKVIEHARHIEVQILGDGRHFAHCFERECSLQRRRQKIWEEAPSIALSVSKRNEICASAVKLATKLKYRGAGTVEFLYDSRTGNYYFIEMNTRIQVEHPVTEFVVGVDLVAEMIRIASGEDLSIKQSDVVVEGHSIEVRINAEDPGNGFLPCPGTILDLRIPDGPGVRCDHMLYPGYEVLPFYDSLLGKLIVWGETRDHALARLKRALSETRIEKLKTTLPLFSILADDNDVRNGQFSTGWLEHWLEVNSIDEHKLNLDETT